ncbi:TonB family protein [Ruegeria sp.]|uniref:TonB family protein n=1 Tax=Ruegeria sp. TaxID=1879320 RepID=UPI002326E2E0|nr:TonB family protein [Ruegeria sp.]MDA7965250.1 TonB family protein [Ruegeria sp.]
MIPRSRAIALGAILLATAAHGLALHDFSEPDTTLFQGGGDAQVAALGSSFKDFAAGTATPAPATTHQDTQQPDQLDPVEKPVPQSPIVTQPTPPQNTPTVAITPKAQTAQKPLEPQASVTPQPKAQKAAKPPVKDTRRPEPEKTDQTASQLGNSAKDAKKGSAAGKTSKGAATAQANKQTASGQGNAAADNYAGTVMRKITRARRKSVKIRGAVFVSFRIADNGNLLSASISRSSGSKRLDQVALAQVRAAAPFPPPPEAARRDYTIRIVGK